jgi:hypothetical protein
MNLGPRQLCIPVALGIAVMLGGCVCPIISLHSFRDVTVTLTEADSGKPVAFAPFRVSYYYDPGEPPFMYYYDLRTPKDVRATTDASGEAVVRLADYAWHTSLCVREKQKDYCVSFSLSKELIRKGGVIEPNYSGVKSPKLRLELHPLRRPNESAGADAGERRVGATSSQAATIFFTEGSVPDHPGG